MLALTEDGEALNEEVAAVLNESLKIFEEERREWLKRPGGYTEADFLAHDPVYSQVEGGIVVRSFRRLDRFEVEVLIDEGYPAFSLYDHNRWYKIRRLYLRGAEILDFYVPDFFLAKDNREDIRKFVWSEFEVKKFQDD